nr:MAG TPA: hypothetical protein [Caudoviricetes sp.]
MHECTSVYDSRYLKGFSLPGPLRGVIRGAAPFDWKGLPGDRIEP